MRHGTGCGFTWGRWFWRCPASRRHECVNNRGHVGVHRCGWCGALLLIDIL